MLVSRERSRVDGCGLPCKDSKTFHVVISKGSQPGQKHVMEGEGDGTVDTAAGDLVFVLQQKSHAKLRRAGGLLVLLQMLTHLNDCMMSPVSDSDHVIQCCLTWNDSKTNSALSMSAGHACAWCKTSCRAEATRCGPRPVYCNNTVDAMLVCKMCDCQNCRISRPYNEAPHRLLWRDKACPAHT